MRIIIVEAVREGQRGQEPRQGEEAMDIKLIDKTLRDEMVGAFERLAKMVREGKLSPAQFMAAQERVYHSYRMVTLKRQAVV